MRRTGKHRGARRIAHAAGARRANSARQQGKLAPRANSSKVNQIILARREPYRRARHDEPASSALNKEESELQRETV